MNSPPPADGRPWSGRLPKVRPQDLDGEQREYAEQTLAGLRPWAQESGFSITDDDGYIMGPVTAYALSPLKSRHLNQWVNAEQTGSPLPATVREVIILTVGIAWRADYEVYGHVAVARSIGLPEPVIQAIRDHAPCDDFTGEFRVAHRFTDDLVRTHRVDDDTYRQALDLFGQDGVLDMVHLIGMYLTTSAILNAFDTPAPPIPPASQQLDS